MYIPCDILRTIMCFLYPQHARVNIFSDIEMILNVRKSIPCVFFAQNVPTKDIFISAYEISSALNVLFQPNPFVKGNPYIPTNMLHRGYCINVKICEYYLSLMTKDSFRRMSTRKHFMMKTALDLEKHIWGCTHQFLKFGKFFHLLRFGGSYAPKSFADSQLIRRLIRELDRFYCFSSELVSFL